MILYTPLAQEDIFPETADPTAGRHFVTYEGRTVYVEQTADGSYQMLRLLSTDPQDFLNERYAPGSILPK